MYNSIVFLYRKNFFRHSILDGTLLLVMFGALGFCYGRHFHWVLLLTLEWPTTKLVNRYSTQHYSHYLPV